jgi:tRNA (cmo5U34)-methyltransferase
MTTSTSEYFNASQSSKYDREIRASIPGYESLHEMTNDLMRAVIPQKANILVVGAGTGMEIVTLGVANPEWRFTAIDLSDEMLSICKTNVSRAGISDRVNIQRGTVDELGMGQTFDAATSLLVSHFIKDTESRIAFFRSIADRMVSGGFFITADITADKSDPTFELFLNAWKAHILNNAGLTPKEVEEDFDQSIQAVSFAPENEVLKIIEAGGFRNVRSFYRAFLFCGWLGFKA